MRIQQKSNGQYVVTIPRGIGDAMNLSGAKADWNVESRDRLSLTVEERDTDD